MSPEVTQQASNPGLCDSFQYSDCLSVMSVLNPEGGRETHGAEMIREGFSKGVRLVLDKGVGWMKMGGGEGMVEEKCWER